jgi:ATP-binding cassette subfamily E protein 1
MVRIAIIHKEKCKPAHCNKECANVCPINKKQIECVKITAKAEIEESLCVACGICQKRCPFGAIEIVNLPSVSEENLVYRYGNNGFALYGLPVPKEGNITGFLGRNGIGKSTAIEILAGKKKINLGKDATEDDVKEFFKGNEMLRYFALLKGKKVAYKPQNLSSLAVDLPVRELLSKLGSEKKIKEFSKKLGVEHLLDNRLNKLSGGELQKMAIIAATLRDADIYFFDEPLAYLDIQERLNVSDFVRELSKSKTVLVVEHDLLILDYLTEYLNIFFGQQGCFGLVSGLKTSKYGINSYLAGFLKEENLRIRDKEINFNFSKNKQVAGRVIGSWPEFTKKQGNFQLEVGPGEIRENHVIGILGRNGTGKTTFVKCLAGEEVEIEGKKGKLNLDMKISYKPQYLFTEEDLSVRDVIVKEKITKKTSSMFNLEAIYLKKIKNLSGGELQRFLIARCLAREADVYLIDEPSAYLDVEERISTAKAIKEIMSEKQKTAFVVDHDLLLMSYLADSVLVFSGEPGKKGKSGKILEFEEGISGLLKDLDITLRKDKESGRPRINSKGSVLDREQKEAGKWAIFSS